MNLLRKGRLSKMNCPNKLKKNSARIWGEGQRKSSLTHFLSLVSFYTYKFSIKYRQLPVNLRITRFRRAFHNIFPQTKTKTKKQDTGDELSNVLVSVNERNMKENDSVTCWNNASLTHLTPKPSSYRNQSIDLHSKLLDWFLYDGNFGVWWVNERKINKRFRNHLGNTFPHSQNLI